MTGPDAYLMTLILLKWDFTGKLSEWVFGVDERTLAPYYVVGLFMEQTSEPEPAGAVGRGSALRSGYHGVAARGSPATNNPPARQAAQSR